MVEWGEREEFLWDVYSNTGVPPAALLNKPELPDDLALYIQKFLLLSSQRQIGLAANPIILSEIYMTAWAYEIEEFDTFVKFIVKLDKEYINLLSKRKSNRV